jgi:hypothetical protein
MKEKIEYLVSKGLTREEALDVVKSVAKEAFVCGEDNIVYDELYGFSSTESFDNWFENINNLK